MDPEYWQFSFGRGVEPAVALDAARKLFAQRFGRQPKRLLMRRGVDVPVSGLDVEAVPWVARNTFCFVVDEEAGDDE